jgi:hypothetical protein
MNSGEQHMKIRLDALIPNMTRNDPTRPDMTQHDLYKLQISELLGTKELHDQGRMQDFG